jgi:EAL domain-containing protein (putative c-di-GMP-specific phosphodiesterase class I)
MILESGHQLVAEGIEDAATLDAVREAGFVRGQGYLVGRPSEKVSRARVSFDNVTQFPGNRCA